MISTQALESMYHKAFMRDSLRAQADTLDQEIIQASMKLNGNAKTPALGKPLEVIQEEGSKRLNRLKNNENALEARK